VQAAMAGLKLKRETLKRLAELLKDNPELRAKLLADSGEKGTIYREELSRLRNTQRSLAQHSTTLTEQEAIAPLGALPPAFADIIRGRLMELADQTTSATGTARIFFPKKATDAQRASLENALTEISQATDALARANLSDPVVMETAFNAVKSAGKAGADLLKDPAWKVIDSNFTKFRLEDFSAMEKSLLAHQSLSTAFRENKGSRFVAQLQDELNSKTRETVLGLSGELSSISGVSEKTDKLIEQLEKLLVTDLTTVQKEALDALKIGSIALAQPAQTTAVTHLEEGVKLLDTAIVEFVKTQSAIKTPPPAGGGAEPMPDPTEAQIAAALEEMLRKLEEEARRTKPPALGIGKTQNLKIEKDWEKNPEDEPKEREEKRKEMEAMKQQQMAQAQKAQRASAEAQQQANAQALQITEGLATKPAVAWKDQAIAAATGKTNWNKLPSELKESLTQDLDSTVPEEYREAIQNYFRDISEANKP